jgi:Flp pilus assembly protein TadB
MGYHGARLPSKTTADALAHLTQASFDIRADQLKDHALFQPALRQLAGIEDNRNERLDSSDGSVPPILWFVMIVGALITLGYPAFLGTSNLVAQTLMTAALAALVALALLPALILDFPFTGQVALTTGAFHEALQQIPPHLKGHPPTGTQ